MTAPVSCCDCGSHLEIVCPKGCDEVERSIAQAAPIDRLATLAPPRRRELKAGTRSHRVYTAKPCRARGKTFTPTGPRSLFCAACREGA